LLYWYKSTNTDAAGLRLSGGEKQRVGIARTLIKNPRIVVLGKKRLNSFLDCCFVLLIFFF
jgi:ABC-type transport system involved in Fe-S cluster assembly fused permease/ATPase subunit